MANNDSVLQRFYNAVKELRSKSLTRAAKEAHTTPRTFRKYNRLEDVVKEQQRQPGKQIEFNFVHDRTAIVVDQFGNVHNVILSKNEMSKYGSYMNQLMPRFGFAPPPRTVIKDINGTSYTLGDFNTYSAVMDIDESITWDELFYPKKG
jgi:hypothetical protein